MTSIAFHPGSRAPSVAPEPSRQSRESMTPEKAADLTGAGWSRLIGGGATAPAATSFRDKGKTVNQWVSNRLLRKLVRPAAEPDGC